MSTSRPAPRADEGGFSLIEMVVSMAVLAAVALAFLPLLARTTSAAATAGTLTTATELVSKQLERVRATPLSTCPAADPQPLGTPVGPPVKDGRGVELQTWGKVDGTCSSTGVVRYVVSVTGPGAGAPLATATTLLLVDPR